MTDYLLYTLKVSICLISFYIFYMLILRNATFFLLNRFFLIMGILLSFSIPVLKCSIFKNPSINLFSSFVDIELIEPDFGFFQTQQLSSHVISINLILIVSAVYLSGISVMFFRLLFSILRIIRLKNNSTSHYIGKLAIVRQRSSNTFSFFNTIFLPENGSNRLIIEHEMAHIDQFHWVDLILTELAAVILWFNPFVVLYKHAVKLQHEYLADRKVIGNSSPVEAYLKCMYQQVQAHVLTGLISPFHSKTIKKRINMITKNKTSVKYIGLYLLAVPLVALLSLAFTTGDQKPGLSSGNANLFISDENKPSIYPVDKKEIKRINGYGERINPKTKEKDFHYAIDIAIPEGEEIVSTADGIVTETSMDSKKGNYILVKHSEIYSTFYSHLKSVTVIAGEKVKKGQMIGYTGNTGLSTGPHLHYEVIEKGERVDPMNFLP